MPRSAGGVKSRSRLGSPRGKDGPGPFDRRAAGGYPSAPLFTTGNVLGALPGLPQEVPVKPQEDSHSSSSHVLVVDQSPDSRAVICTILQRHGWRTLEAADAAEGLLLARQHAPRVVVADLEHDAVQDRDLCAAYASECRRYNTALLLMGVSRKAAADVPSDCIVPKPYHYGPLIRKIEQLCRRASAEGERSPRSGGFARAA